MNNVDNDLWTTQDLISPDNTGCMDAMEALHCIVCSPDQATFLSEKKGGLWEVDLCYSTTLAVYNLCLPDLPKLLSLGRSDPSHSNTTHLTPSQAVSMLVTRLLTGKDHNNGDPDLPFTGKALLPGDLLLETESVEYGKCFLHDTMSPLLLNATYNGSALRIIFNEPLSVVGQAGIHVEASDLESTTPSASGTNGKSKKPLVAIIKCATKDCISSSNPTVNEFDGTIVWESFTLSTDPDGNPHSTYETTMYLTDTLIVPTYNQKGHTHTNDLKADTVDVIQEDMKMTGKPADYGYVVWLSDNIVFDRAGNAFAGSDMDLDGAIQIDLSQEKSHNLWIWLVVGLFAVLICVSVGAMGYRKKMGMEMCCCSMCTGDSGSTDKTFFSSGGFVAIGDA